MQRDPQEEADQARTLEGLKLADRYRLDSFVGQGGFASVFRATDLRMHIEVAVKVAKPQTTTSVLERFQHETKLGAQLPPHPGVARSTDRGLIPNEGPYGGQPFLVTDFVDGDALDKRLIFYPGPYPVSNTLRIASDLADALQHLHSQGIVHRDVKPTNVIVRDDGSAVLIDFGLAFATGDGSAPRSPDLTEARQVVGTGHYMSPEQAVGLRPTYSFDVYALGATLFEVLIGNPPLGHIDDGSVRQRKLTEKIPPVARLRHDIPSSFAELIDAMLSTNAEDRPTLEHVRKSLRCLRSESEEIGRATVAKRIYEEAGPDGRVAVPLVHAKALLARQNAAAYNKPVATPAPEATSPVPEPEPHPELSPSSKTNRGRLLAFTLIALSIVTIGLSATIWHRRTNTEHPLRLAPSLSFPELSVPVTAPVEEPKPQAEPEPHNTEPEPTPEPLEIPEPEQHKKKHSPSRAKKPRTPVDSAPSTPPPPETAKAAPCPAQRESARKAVKSKRWKVVLSSTKDASCWPSKTERSRLRATALKKLGRYAECVTVTHGATDNEVTKLGKECYRHLIEK